MGGTASMGACAPAAMVSPRVALSPPIGMAAAAAAASAGAGASSSRSHAASKIVSSSDKETSGRVFRPGMLVLSKSTFDTPLRDSQYISPTEHQPGLEMPSIRETFSFEAPEITIPAISQILCNSPSWYMTILTVILRGPTLLSDANKAKTIIRSLPVDLLERLEYLVLEINHRPCVFSVGRLCGEFTPAEIGTSKIHSIRNVLARIAPLAVLPKNEFCLTVLHRFSALELSICELSSIIFPLNEEADWEFCRRVTAEPFDPRLKFSASVSSDFLLDSAKLNCLTYFSYFSFEDIEGDVEPVSFNFSGCSRMVKLSVICNNKCLRVTLPPSRGELEFLSLQLYQYIGPRIFEGEILYPRLRSICATIQAVGGCNIGLDSERFPALRSVSCASPDGGTLLDLSGITTPGLDLDLTSYTGRALLFPKVELSRLHIDGSSLSCGVIEAALPRIRNLVFMGQSQSHFNRLLSILRGPASASAVGAGAVATEASSPLTSTNLEVLHLCSFSNIYLLMRDFPRLRELTLHGISTELRGQDFPQLIFLKISSADANITGIFPRLHSMVLSGPHLAVRVSCNAPALRELTCDSLRDATGIVLGPEAFPMLRLLNIFLSPHVVHFEKALPTFDSDYPPAWPTNITVRLRHKTFPTFPSAVVDRVKEALHGCRLI